MILNQRLVSLEVTILMLSVDLFQRRHGLVSRLQGFYTQMWQLILPGMDINNRGMILFKYKDNTALTHLLLLFSDIFRPNPFIDNHSSGLSVT